MYDLRGERGSRTPFAHFYAPIFSRFIGTFCSKRMHISERECDFSTLQLFNERVYMNFNGTSEINKYLKCTILRAVLRAADLHANHTPSCTQTHTLHFTVERRNEQIKITA